MSLDLHTILSSRAGFPRVSGDEPVVTEIGPVVILFSPRERG